MPDSSMLEPADDARGAALEDPDDAPFGALAAVRSRRATTRSPCIA